MGETNIRASLAAIVGLAAELVSAAETSLAAAINLAAETSSAAKTIAANRGKLRMFEGSLPKL